jgi:hypothetical protein
VGVDADDERVGVRDDCHGRSTLLPREGTWVTVAKRPVPVREESLRGRSVMGHDPRGRAVS